MKILICALLFGTAFSKQHITLDAAIQIGRKNNIQHKLSEIDLEYSNEQILQGYLNFAPSLTFNTSYVTVSDFALQQQEAQVNGFKALLKQFGLNDFADDIPNTAFKNVHRSNLSLQWNLFAKGQALRVLSELKSQREIQTITLKQSEIETIYKIREAFYELYISGEFKNLAKFRLDNMKSRVEQVQNLVDKGFRNNAELLRWRIELSKAEETNLEAEIMFKNAQKMFAFTIGEKMDRQYFAILEGGINENLFSDINEDYLTSVKIDELLDLQKLNFQKKIADDNRYYTYGKFLPSVDLNWRKTWQQSNEFLPAQQPWELSLNFSWELFSSFRDYLELEKTEISVRKSELLSQDKKRQLEMSLSQLYLNLDKTRKQLKTSRYTVELARESYRIQKNRFDKGLSTNLDLVDAEIQLYQSNLDALKVYKSFILSGYSLKKLLGHIN